MNTGLSDVLNALQGSGITAANFSSLSTFETIMSGAFSSSTLQWTFNLPVSLTNTQATVASLNTLQQKIANLKNGLALLFNITGTQISQQLAQSQTCSFSGLIASATTQAQSLAAAGGVTLGSIVAMSSSTSNVGASPFPTAPPCAVTVTFGVVRN